MGDSHSWKPGTRPGRSPSPAQPTAAPTKPAPATGTPSNKAAGRIVHDARGNAVWDWVKDTARSAVDSTSRLLRRLEVPELKVEDTQDQELRIESDRDAGGGYDPYGGSGASSSRTTNTPDFGRSPNTASSRGGSSAGSRGGPTNNPGSGQDPYGRSGAPAGRNAGGGYDPYGKSATNPPRKR